MKHNEPFSENWPSKSKPNLWFVEQEHMKILKLKDTSGTTFSFNQFLKFGY